MTDSRQLQWGDETLRLQVLVDGDGRVRLTGLGGGEHDGTVDALPLVEIVTPTRSKLSGARYDRTDLGVDLRYVADRESVDADGVLAWEIDLRDPLSPLVATIRYVRRPGSGAVSTSVRVAHEGAGETELLFVSSAALGIPRWRADTTIIHLADNEWLAENRWRRGAFDALGGPDVGMTAHAGAAPRGCFAVVGRGTWSTGAHLPMGVLEEPGGAALAWQVESGGGWRWQLARAAGPGDAGHLTLVTSGPTDEEHNWSVVLRDGDEFTTPVTTLVWAPAGVDDAIAALTAHRRADRVEYEGDAGMPVVYNDYMNTLMADPTTAKLLPLISAVARTGAEIFVVDAGWYSDEPGWWGTVGAWTESTTRFPGGLVEVMDAIRAHGMAPGLWLEPEVVGVDSPVARSLPDDAFFQRRGVRVVDNGRFRLDYRHPVVAERMMAVIDRLVAVYGLRYIKFDDNIDPTAGTDVAGTRPGEGIRAASAAFLHWVDAIRVRHPLLVLENCSSGGMRADWMTTSHFALLSTSDQQDALRCVPIAAASPMIVPPEQAGVWSYPCGGMAPGEAVVTLANSILRRPILSGRIDTMDDDELARVREYVDVHKDLRADIARARPTWPLGLPAWEDPWVAAALVVEGGALLTVWRRGGESEAAIPLAGLGLATAAPAVQVLFPQESEASWRVDDGVLIVGLDAPSAVVLRIGDRGAGARN